MFVNVVLLYATEVRTGGGFNERFTILGVRYKFYEEPEEKFNYKLNIEENQ